MGKIIELSNNEFFTEVICNEVVSGLLYNGYTLNLTPCKYSDKCYTLMIEIGEIDDSFIETEEHPW